jgi:hypothetical protein
MVWCLVCGPSRQRFPGTTLANAVCLVLDISDSSAIASEVECEDGVEIVATPSTSAKQTRKVKARSSVRKQPANMGCKANASRIFGLS